MEADQDAFRKALVRSVSACCDLEDKAQQSAATTSMTKLAEAMILNTARGENACYAELESMLVMMTTDNGAGPGDPQFLEMKNQYRAMLDLANERFSLFEGGNGHAPLCTEATCVESCSLCH